MQPADAVSYLGSAAAIVLFISPWQSVSGIRRKGSVEGVPYTPFFMMVLSSFVWLLYGVMVGSPGIMLCNAVGVACGTLYSSIYYANAEKKDTLLRVFFLCIVGFGGLIYFFILFPFVYAQAVLGVTCSTMSVLFFGSPLLEVQKVIQKQDASSLDRNMSLMTVVNTVLWLTFGVMIGDIVVVLPNTLGLLLGIVQVALIIAYPPKTAKQG